MLGDSPEASIGAGVRILRQQRGLTLEELATKSGVSAGYLSMIEAGHRRPALKTCKAISKALGVDVQALMLAPAVLKKFWEALDARGIDKQLAILSNAFHEAEARLRDIERSRAG